jgi:hypothetical protein
VGVEIIMKKLTKYGKTVTGILTALLTNGYLVFLSPELQAKLMAILEILTGGGSV